MCEMYNKEWQGVADWAFRYICSSTFLRKVIFENSVDNDVILFYNVFIEGKHYIMRRLLTWALQHS
jgi:hypothetical protein